MAMPDGLGVRSFGVRQLAAAFLPASLLTGEKVAASLPRHMAA